MTLPASGAISLGQVNTELGRSSSAQINMNDTGLRNLFGVSQTSGSSFAMSAGYGKSSGFIFNITTSQNNFNLRTAAIAAGWNQTALVRATIAGGVVISSTATGTPACTISGSFPGGVQLYNFGVIIGQGGVGGNGGASVTGGAGGGTGLLVTVPVTIDNPSTIAGGGGGGGGGAKAVIQFEDPSNGSLTSTDYFGGGGGGGRTGQGTTGGGTGGSGASNGGSGTTSVAGAGGAGSGGVGGTGGVGGDLGAWGAPGGTSSDGNAGGAGGAPGAAVSGNSNITWINTGTRLGVIS